MRKTKQEYKIVHVFKDGTVSDSTSEHFVPRELYERVVECAANAHRAHIAREKGASSNAHKAAF